MEKEYDYDWSMEYCKCLKDTQLISVELTLKDGTKVTCSRYQTPCLDIHGIQRVAEEVAELAFRNKAQLLSDNAVDHIIEESLND